MAKSLDKILKVFTGLVKEIEEHIADKHADIQTSETAATFHESEAQDHRNDVELHKFAINKARRVKEQIEQIIK